MLHRCLEASAGLDGQVEVIDLRTIVPWDREAVLGSVKKTGKLLIAHEDTRTVGFGAEIAAVVSEEAFTDLDAPVVRVTTPDMPIPYNLRSMEAVIPSVEVLWAKIHHLLNW
jgi:2-oxoisovalerate dehydrogenase E1 component